MNVVKSHSDRTITSSFHPIQGHQENLVTEITLTYTGAKQKLDCVTGSLPA